MYDGDDRTKQIEELRGLAIDICDSLVSGAQLEDPEFSETLRLWYMPDDIPDWFDDKDMELLIQMVRRECGD